MVDNLSGWQGAANNTTSKKKTDELIEAAKQEFDTTRIGPKIHIMGDFNTEMDRSMAMRKLLAHNRGRTSDASPRALRMEPRNPREEILS